MQKAGTLLEWFSKNAQAKLLVLCICLLQYNPKEQKLDLLEEICYLPHSLQ